MGVTLQCKKTGTSIDMGYGGFNRLRDKVAELTGEPFASHMKKLNFQTCMSLQFASKEERDKFNADFNAKTQRMIDAKQVSVKIVDFCLQPDCEGKIHYGACKEILKVIGDYDDDIAYGYTGRKDCAMFRDFKALLQECVDNRCMLTWW